jgi:hypothetical protein
MWITWVRVPVIGASCGIPVREEISGSDGTDNEMVKVGLMVRVPIGREAELLTPLLQVRVLSNQLDLTRLDLHNVDLKDEGTARGAWTECTLWVAV